MIHQKSKKKDFMYYLFCHNPKSILLDSNTKINYKWLVHNKNLRIQDIMQFPSKKWIWKDIFVHSMFDIQTMNTHFDKIKWNFQLLSKNKSITKEIVLFYSSQNWNWKELSNHIDWDIVLLLPDKPWDYKKISKGKRRYWCDLGSLCGEIERCVQCNITWQDVQNHPQIPWDYSVLSDNPNITMENILQNMDKEWNFENVMQNINFSFQYQKQFEEKGIFVDCWHEKHLIYHANTTLEEWDTILDGDMERDYKCYFVLLSYNPNVTWDYFINLDFRWDYSFMMKYGFFRERMLFVQHKIQERSRFLQELKEKFN
jgi:hypothetical protein